MAASNVAYTRPWVYPAQRDGIFCPERYGIIEASTKAGKTVGCMVWITEQAMGGRAGWNYWWVSPIRDQAKIVFRRLKRALPRALYHPQETELTLTLRNGAVIWFKGADHPDSLYGEDVYAAVIDEASRCKEDAWHAVRSTLTATQGPVRIIGNVKGRKNWAYQMARRAEAGEPGMHYARITAKDAVDAGLIPAEEVEDARRQLPAHVFRELYEAIPADDEGNPFGGPPAIQACVMDEALLEMAADTSVVAWGWDLAKSTDWTVGVGLSATGHVVRTHRFQKPWEDTIAEIIAKTDAIALVDSTGVGDPILERLQKLQPARFLGFKFTSASKQQLMEGLAVAIQQRAIRYPAGTLVAELEAFEYEYTRTGVRYTAPEGVHDDCVCALALAVQQFNSSPAAMMIWGGFDLNDNEQEAADLAQREEAARAVSDAIAETGYFWPGGR